MRHENGVMLSNQVVSEQIDSGSTVNHDRPWDVHDIGRLDISSNTCMPKRTKINKTLSRLSFQCINKR